MKRADLKNLRLEVAFADLDSLATLVSALDGHNEVDERNEYVAQAHEILTRALGEYAVAVYGKEDEPSIKSGCYVEDGLSPLERFRAEQALKSEGVVYLNSQLKDRRHHESWLSRLFGDVFKKVSAT